MIHFFRCFWYEFSFASTNIQTETDNDNDNDDEDDTEYPQEEDVGSIISVLDGWYHLLLKPEHDWNRITSWWNSRILKEILEGK